MFFAIQAHVQEHAQEHAAGSGEKFEAGKTIIEHVTNSGLDHPLIHLPTIAGIDFSVTKHVLMLWLVASIVFIAVTFAVRRYLKRDQSVPSGFANVIEWITEFVRDSIVLPNVGKKWVNTWTPLLLTFFVFILTANAMGLIPIFEIVALLDLWVLHTSEGSFLKQVVHGGTTATANFNVTAALATITFASIIVAGSKAHGFFGHWKNLVPHGLNPAIYVILIPIEIMGMFVRPFALTMRLAANMTGGHIAILAILSFVFLFTEIAGTALAGIGIGLVVSVPMAALISALEIIVVLVQAYVFTLLTAVFIGMAIHAHH
jgi:F-type H+-transporting ATPase subunit a